MTIDFKQPDIQSHMLEGQFGLERENLRIDAKGRLAHTNHPFGDDAHISRDFCENQVEIITDVANSAKEVVAALEKLHRIVKDTLLRLDEGKEYLWPFSNPPYIGGEDDIVIAHFRGAQKSKEVYRNYLAKKYGKKKMLFSGIHCNYSFSEAFLVQAYKSSALSSLQEYKNQLYLALAKRLTQYSWLIVYLTAASPVMDASFFDQDGTNSRYASARCSAIGYWNDFVPVLSYDSLETYVKSIQNYIDDGKLYSVSELYYPIRLKPKGDNTLERLGANGINHIELRMLDVNPLSPAGVFAEDIDFIQLLIVYLIAKEEETFDSKEQILAIENMKKSAELEDANIWIRDAKGTSKPIREAALAVLNDMERFFLTLSVPGNVLALLQYQKDKILYPDKRYAVTVKKRFEDEYTAKGLALAKEYAQLW